MAYYGSSSPIFGCSSTLPRATSLTTIAPVADLAPAVQIAAVKHYRTKIRTVLISTLLVVIAIDAAWFAFRQKPESVAFLLEPTATSFLDNMNAPDAFPLFDPAMRKWRLRGKALPSLAPFIQNLDPQNLGPDSIGNFIALRFPETMTAAFLHPVLLSLSDQGICKFAALDFGQAGPGSRFPQGDVYVLKSVRDDHGQVHLCQDTINYRR